MRLLSVDSFADAPIAECEPGFTIAVVNRGPHLAFAGALFAQPAFQAVDRQITQRSEMAGCRGFVQLRVVVLDAVGMRSLASLVFQKRLDVVRDRDRSMIRDAVLFRGQNVRLDVFGSFQQIGQHSVCCVLLPTSRRNFANHAFPVSVLGRPGCRFGFDAFAVCGQFRGSFLAAAVGPLCELLGFTFHRPSDDLCAVGNWFRVLLLEKRCH
ncbi:hypothetical protein [Rhodopirellula baltica]|uniref:hypothetical protein n=1 Tax=Rhodopirellula baltica TaxID=265606 RepID=UPI0023F0258B|nr:hypothetical protein [Rhodopirellula baltica]